MSARHLIVAVSLLCAAAAAHAGIVDALPESATVSIVFIALAAVGLAATRKRHAPVEADQA